MTLISTIIRDAYRESNLIAITADPTTAEQTEGLRLLNRLVPSLFGNEAGDPLETVPVGRNNVNVDVEPTLSDNIVPLNSRLVLNLTAAKTLYLSPKPQDGSRLAVIDKSGNLSTYNLVLRGNGYTIAGAATATLSTNSLSREYFFRADTGDWSLLADLEADDSSPFPQKFDDMLVIGLAIRLNPRNGTAISGESLEAYKSSLRKFRAQYCQNVSARVEEALLKTSVNHLSHYDYDDFNTGRM